MDDLIDRLKDEAVKVAMERSPDGLSSRDITGSVIHEAAMAMEALRDALVEFMDSTSPAATPAFVDPQYGEAVQKLGEAIGYGALISSASASWRISNSLAGYPTGGEFVVGPCMSTLIADRAQARQALSLLVKKPKNPRSKR